MKYAKCTRNRARVEAEHTIARRHRGDAGFTLIELMISLMVLAFGQGTKAALLNKNLVDPRPLLKAKQLLGDSAH